MNPAKTTRGHSLKTKLSIGQEMSVAFYLVATLARAWRIHRLATVATTIIDGPMRSIHKRRFAGIGWCVNWLLLWLCCEYSCAAERLYAVAMCHPSVGFENPERTHRTDRRDREHPFRARRAHDAICRQVGPDPGTFGPVVPTGSNVPASENPGLSIGDWQDEKVRSVGNAVRETLRTPGNIPAWCPPGIRIPRAVDGGRLCEPTVYRTADGKYMMLLRDDAYSHRMYASLSADGQHWDAAVPTDIPDSPSLTTSRTLPDGTVLLIGNQMAPEFDNGGRLPAKSTAGAEVPSIHPP